MHWNLKIWRFLEISKIIEKVARKYNKYKNVSTQPPLEFLFSNWDRKNYTVYTVFMKTIKIRHIFSTDRLRFPIFFCIIQYRNAGTALYEM